MPDSTKITQKMKHFKGRQVIKMRGCMYLNENRVEFRTYLDVDVKRFISVD
jgi:hypothetical protein